ncbi:unnamed protein product [Effrenium voratum]|nr:unnamed protein product [Effrenium voratum]
MLPFSACRECCPEHPVEDTITIMSPLEDDGIGLAVPFQDCDPLEPRKFLVKIRRSPSANLGIDFDTVDQRVCAVVRIQQGLAQRWNSAHRWGIQRHDRLVAVNGRSPPQASELLISTQTSTDLELVFERPTVHKVQVTRGKDEKLGLSLSSSKSSASICVKRVEPDGTIMRQTEREGIKLKAHDRIIQVNGQEDCTEMAKQLAAPQVSLKICSYDLCDD